MDDRRVYTGKRDGKREFRIRHIAGDEGVQARRQLKELQLKKQKDIISNEILNITSSIISCHYDRIPGFQKVLDIEYIINLVTTIRDMINCYYHTGFVPEVITIKTLKNDLKKKQYFEETGGFYLLSTQLEIILKHLYDSLDNIEYGPILIDLNDKLSSLNNQILKILPSLNEKPTNSI